MKFARLAVGPTTRTFAAVSTFFYMRCTLLGEYQARQSHVHLYTCTPGQEYRNSTRPFLTLPGILLGNEGVSHTTQHTSECDRLDAGLIRRRPSH